MAASDDPKPTLYDFLFIDYPRVQSLYSQLYSGLLSEITSLVADTKSTETELKAGGAPVGSLASRRKEQSDQSRSESVDPHDVILRDVLGGLTEADMISIDPATAQPGNIILIQGKTYILDFGVYENMLQILPYMMVQTEEIGSRTVRKKHQKDMKSGLDLLKGLAKIVPWSIHLLMESKSATAWGAIKKEHFRDDPANLALKYGPSLAGDWYMLGIVDAVAAPDPADDSTFPEIVRSLIQAVSTMRPVFGRPDNFIGVTPLLLFRKLAV